MTVGERIKNRREELGISQVDLAISINTSKQTLYKYEKGIITNIPSDKIELIAKALHTTPAQLMGWEDLRLLERDQILETIDSLLFDNGFSLICDSYDDEYYTIKTDGDSWRIRVNRLLDGYKSVVATEHKLLFEPFMKVIKPYLHHDSDTDTGYYHNPETAQAAQEIFENKELRLLFDAARDSSPEDLQTVHQMLLALKRKERHE
ncbi:MAG: helix-turn-helix domain-containing protein [Stomatobaculum sp.]